MPIDFTQLSIEELRVRFQKLQDKLEHLEKYPDLHDKVWKLLKLAGKNKQSVDAEAAAQLEAAVKVFGEIFWATKK